MCTIGTAKEIERQIISGRLPKAAEVSAMKRVLLSLVLFALLGCTSSRPPMPVFDTSVGRECGIQCRKGHRWCMEATCPAKATSNCRPKCDRKLRECYDACLEGHRAPEGSPVK